MDLKDRFTPATSLIGEIVHEGRQTDASAAEESDYGLDHLGQYSWRTFETKRKDLPLIQLSSPTKSKEFLDPGVHGDMEEGIFDVQPRTMGAMTEPFPDTFHLFHDEVNVANVFIEFLQIQDRSPFVRNSLRFRYCEV